MPVNQVNRILKISLAIAALFISLFSTSVLAESCPAPNANAGQVIVNELSFHGKNSQNNWIELYINNGSVSLAGWELELLGQGNIDESIDLPSINFPWNGNSSGRFIVIAASTNSSEISNAIANGTLVLGQNLFIDSDLDLHNTIQDVLLTDSSGDLVYYLGYANQVSQLEYDCIDQYPDYADTIISSGNDDHACTAVDGVSSGNVGGDWEPGCSGEISVGTSNDQASLLSHFQIEHNVDANAGVAETITIKACVNADCSVLLDEPVSAEISLSSGNGSFNLSTVNISTGTATTLLSVASSQTVTLALSNMFPSATYQCVGSNGSDSCQINFQDVSLLAQYQLEEAQWSGSDSILDASGNGNNASPIGGITNILNDSQVSCRAANIPSNNSSSLYDAIDTKLDVDSDIGASGTIAFWFRSKEDWYGASKSRQLFDASKSSSGLYFYAALNTFGRIEFGMEDNVDTDRRVMTGINSFSAGEWVHLAFTYDINSGDLLIYINGNQVSTSFIASGTLNGNFGDLDTLYIGDNRSSYIVSYGTGNSLDGAVDEIYVYSGVLDSTEINNLKNTTSTCSVPLPSPIAYWTIDVCSLNGTSGEIIDTVNGYNGQSLGGTGIDENGQFCQAADFFGNDEHLNIPHQTDFEAADGAVSFWFKRDSGSSGDMGLFSKDSLDFDNGGHLSIWSRSSRTVMIRHQYVDYYYGYNLYLESNVVSDDAWHHVVYTWGSDGAALYVDNQLVDQDASVTAGIEGNPEPIILGADATITSNQSSPGYQLLEFFDGRIDDIQFFNQQLSGTHVGQVFNQSSYTCTTCNNDPVLESLWTMDMCSINGTSGEIIDTGDSNLSNHGTALGDPSIEPDAKFCQAINFAGNDEHINISHQANYATLKGAVSFWFRRQTGTSGDMGLFSKDSSGHDDGGHLTIWSKSNRSLEVRHQYMDGSTQRTEYLNSSALNDGEWHHVMYTWGNQGLILYVDNQLVEQNSSVQASIVNNAEPIILGASAITSGNLVSDPSDLNQFFSGDIDDVRIYSTNQPDSTDVSALYNQSPYSCAETCNITPILESHWAMDLCSLNGSSGEILDIGDSSLDNHGTSLGGAAINQSGKYCQAVNFSGDDEHLNIPHNANYETGRGGISFWFKRNSGTSGDMGIFSKDSSGHDAGGHLTIWSKSNRTIYVRHQYKDGSSNLTGVLESGTVSDDNWHHVFYTWGSDGMTLYVDNQLVDQESSRTAGITNNDEPIIIGASAIYTGNQVSEPGQLDQFFDGDIDDIKLYSTWQPDATLVSDVYNQSSYTCTNCQTQAVAWYQFEEGSWPSGNTIIDTMNNHVGSPIGSVSPVLPASPMSCQAMNVPDNNSRSIIDAMDTSINIKNDVGSAGTISFWYKANNAWNAGGNANKRMLFDASSSSSQRFYLRLGKDGNLRFFLEDSASRNFSMTSGNLNFSANEWVFVAVTWDLVAGQFRAYAKTDSTDVDLSLTKSSYTDEFGTLKTLYIGDNRNTYYVDSIYKGSADGQIDNVRVYNFAQTESEIETDMDDNNGCISQVHHYDLSFTSPGSVCADSTLTVRACSDANCSSIVDVGSTIDIQYTDAGSSTSTVVSSLALINGVGTHDWGLGTAQTVTMSLANAMPVALNQDTCDPANCELVFNDVTLNILVDDQDVAIPTQVAQTNFAQTIKIVPDQSCGNLPPITPLELAIECISPATCFAGGSDIFTVGGITIPENQAGNVVNFAIADVNFNSTVGETLGPLVYHDAGQIRLHARVGTATVSKEFVVKPQQLVLSSAASNPQTAGLDFGLTLKAVGSLGGDLPSYSAGDIEAKVQRELPAGGDSRDGRFVFSNSGGVPGTSEVTSNNNYAKINVALLNMNSGVSQNLQAFYSEAGNVNVIVKDVDYLGEQINPSAAILSGFNFIPAFFSVADNSPSLVNTCTSFSYWGEPIDLSSRVAVTISAFNAESTPQETRNYKGWNLGQQDSDIGAPSAVNWGVTASNVLDDSGSDLPDGSPYDATLLVDFDAVMTFDKDHTPQIPASSPPASILIDKNFLTDQANANLCYKSTPFGACLDYSVANITGASLRWGRLVLDNVFGAEIQSLSMPIRTEYLNSAGEFVTNDSDSCTLYNWAETSGQISLTTPPGETDITGFIAPVSGAGTLVNGVSIDYQGIIIPSPGSGIIGTAIISLVPDAINVDWPEYLNYDWDENGFICTPDKLGSSVSCDSTGELDRPFAAASFGQYRGNDRIIHWREVFR